MVDSLSPAPPINPKVTKTQVAEKNPHHQNDRRQKDNHTEEEILDEVMVEGIQEEGASEISQKTHEKSPSHNIDIEV